MLDSCDGKMVKKIKIFVILMYKSKRKYVVFSLFSFFVFQEIYVYQALPLNSLSVTPLRMKLCR